MPKNPFVHRLKMTPNQRLQVVVMTCSLIAPIRFMLALAALLVAWLCGAIFTIGIPSDFSQPISKFRQSLYNLLRLMGRGILTIVGVTIEIKGKRVTSSEAPILIASPHTSHMDILLWFVTGDLPAAMSKQENFKLPIFGTLLRAVQPVFVTRTEEKSRSQALNRLRDRVSSPDRWPQVIIFPEGTCHNGKSLIKFQRGAFVVGVPVQPMVVHFVNDFDYTSWTEVSESALKLIWIMLCQFRTKVVVHYLPVYHPNKEEIVDANLYAENVRRKISSHQHLPYSEFSYEDRILMRHARKLGFPVESAVVEFHRIRARFGLRLEDLRRLLNEFAKVTSLRPEADVSDFSNFLGVPDHLPCMKSLLSLYDVNNSGTISFQDYVVGYSSVSSFCDDDVDLQDKIKEIVLGDNLKDDTELNELVKSIKLHCEINSSNIDELRMTRPEYFQLFKFCFAAMKR